MPLLVKKISLLVTMLGLCNFQLQAQAQSQSQLSVTAKPLEKGVVIKNTLKDKSSHTYDLNLAANQYVFGDAFQISVDLKVSIYDPSGDRIVSFDSPARGSETFQFSSTVAGKYQVKVSPFQDAQGDYSIELIKSEPIATTAEGKVSQLMSAINQKTPGAVVAIVRNGKLTYGQGFGLANLEYDIPNSTTTPYHMASVAKQFTALAIVMLANEEKLSIDEDIQSYLPDMPKFEHKITIRHLLNHTSGLRDHWALWRMSGGLMDDVIRQSDLMRLIKRQKDLNFKPGHQYMYSNTGYLLLSEIVTAVSGQKFADWMRVNIFKPLGMNNTQIYDNHERIIKNRAYSYKNSNTGLAKSVLSYANTGATSLFSTAEDLALWFGNFHTGKVGGKKAIKQLQQQGLLNNGDTIDYALGLFVDKENGLKRISHGGADAGYRTYVSYYPELDVGLILLANSAGFPGYMIAQDVAAAFFGEHMVYKSQPEKRNNPATPPSKPAQQEWQPSVAELSSYKGRYYSGELDTFYMVCIEEGRLKISHTRHGEHYLSAKEKDTFRADQGYLGIVKFYRSKDKVVEQLSFSNGRVRNLMLDKINTLKE
jgi:CubicO group peptidase (beta-lactamase class C family)